MDTYRIESEMEVKAYLANLRYALDKGARIMIQTERKVDENREEQYTNGYTIRNMFPNGTLEEIMQRELKSLTKEDYIRTVKDIRFPSRSEMREFGKLYNDKDEIYIKIRVELLTENTFGGHIVFVMSFHHMTIQFSKTAFPYKR